MILSPSFAYLSFIPPYSQAVVPKHIVNHCLCSVINVQQTQEIILCTDPKQIEINTLIPFLHSLFQQLQCFTGGY